MSGVSSSLLYLSTGKKRSALSAVSNQDLLLLKKPYKYFHSLQWYNIRILEGVKICLFICKRISWMNMDFDVIGQGDQLDLSTLRYGGVSPSTSWPVYNGYLRQVAIRSTGIPPFGQSDLRCSYGSRAGRDLWQIAVNVHWQFLYCPVVSESECRDLTCLVFHMINLYFGQFLSS